MSQPPSIPQDPGEDPPPPDQPPAGPAPPPSYGPPPPQPPTGPPAPKNNRVLYSMLGGLALLFGIIVIIANIGKGPQAPAAAGFPSSVASGAPSAGAPSAGAPSAGAPSAGAPSAGAPSAGAPSAGAPSASPTSYDEGCTSHTCIAAYLDQNLVGLVALDYAVSTKVTCYSSTVVYHAAAGTYSANCTVNYSDGSSAYGTGNLITSSDAVTFTPSGA